MADPHLSEPTAPDLVDLAPNPSAADPGSHSPDIEELLRSAAALGPDDRLYLIARLWASLPPEHWAAPTSQERDKIISRLSPATAESIFDVPWRIVDRVLEQHERVAGTKIYSAPRRFDLATVFVVTTAYCLLFASLSATTWPGYVNLIIAAFITLVGVGQAVIYRGLRPRQASIWVGIVLCNLGMIVYLYLRGRMVTPGTILGGFIYAAIGGAILGYLAGTLVGGIFLIIDFVRRRFTPPPETIPAELPVAISATPPSPEVS